VLLLARHVRRESPRQDETPGRRAFDHLSDQKDIAVFPGAEVGTMSLVELADFLVETKVNTYAAQKGKIDSSRKGSHDLAYRKGGYSSVDSYFGEKDFSGAEIVYQEEKPIWSMNYYWKMLRDDVPRPPRQFCASAQRHDDTRRAPVERTRGSGFRDRPLDGHLREYDDHHHGSAPFIRFRIRP
jgi:hypothetical protein